MAYSRPDVVIKVFPQKTFAEDKLGVLNTLKKTNALILNLRENVPNVKPFPFIYFQRIGSSDALPENLKNDGDPCSDYFVTLKSFKKSAPTSSDKTTKPGYVIMAFKVIDDDKTHFFDKTWDEWTGTARLIKELSKFYDLRKVACYKGVNVIPDIFKYVVLIEFTMDAYQTDLAAMDCLQRFRIGRMSGYVSLYTDFRSRDIVQAIDEEADSVGEIMQSI